MKSQHIHDMLRQTLEDRRLSRTERAALGRILDGVDLTEQTIATFRKTAFKLASKNLADSGGDPTNREAVLQWLEDIVRLLQSRAASDRHGTLAESHFAPGDHCPRRIASLIGGARKTIDVCVFTITDDRISDALLEAHRRDVALRIVTDDDKSEDLGSDIQRLRKAGVAVRIDRTPHHMHHKFSLFDGNVLLTGSYNWTRSAARDNEENFLVTDDRRFVEPFSRLFEKLWDAFS